MDSAGGEGGRGDQIAGGGFAGDRGGSTGVMVESSNGAAVAPPTEAVAVPKKRSRWGAKEETAEGGAALPGGDDAGDTKRQRKSKVSVLLCVYSDADVLSGDCLARAFDRP